MSHKSLIVKLGAIGDVACVLPGAWKLHQSGSEIDWLCGKVVAPLLSCYSWVHPIVVDDAKLMGGNRVDTIREVIATWGKLLGSSYDLSAILQYDRRFRVLTLPVHARRSISFSHTERASRLVSERHHSAEYARILCGLPDEYHEENVAPQSPDFLPSNPLPRNGKVRIGLAPGGARNLQRDDPQRRWPVKSYVALARLLVNNGYEVVLTGGPSDEWVVPEFVGLPVEDRIGQWSIPQTIAFYGSCDCVVTHDTGPLHLAGLTQCGLVGIFGPTAPSKALPRRRGVVGLWGGERLPCRPCYDGKGFACCSWNKCMTSITPENVYSTVLGVTANPYAEWQVKNL